MRRNITLFGYYAVSAFLSASGGYMILHALMPHGHVFGQLYRMFLYHDAHPFQYIALVAVVYAAISTMTAGYFARANGKTKRPTLFVAIVAATLAIASVPGGMLWKIHDMQAGWFTTGERFRQDLLDVAIMGIECGWAIILFSFPYNVIGLFVGYAITAKGADLYHRMEPYAPRDPGMSIA